MRLFDREDFTQRYLNYETFKGVFFLLVSPPNLWVALYMQRQSLFWAWVTICTYFFLEGLRKIFVNRIKQEERKKRLTAKELEMHK